LLDLAARDRVLDRHLDDVADVRVAALGTAKHLDAHHFLGARVVGHVEVALHLDHCKASLFGRAGEDLDHAPVLGLGQRRALGHADHVAGVAGVVGVVGVQLGRAADVLAVQRVLDLALHEHRHRLVHLVADHAAFDRVQLLAIVLGHLSPVLTSSHRAGCSRERSRGAPGGLRGSWQAARWPSACAGRTAPCAARPGGPAALPPTSDASASCPSAHRPGHELGGHRELGGGQAERLARGRLVDALDLVDHAARLDLRDPVLDVALAGAHADLDGLLGDRLVGEHADPHLAAALDVAADRAACRLDLARGQLPGGGRLQPVLAEADGIAVPGQALVAALVHLAELGSLGLQHGLFPRLAAVTTIVTARSARAVAPVATVAARRVVLLFLADLGEVEDLALVDPHLDADDPVGGPRLGEAVVDVRAQGMQRHAALAVPLRTRDLGAVQAAGHVDLDTQRTQAHRVADGALHRAAEHDAALELLRDRLGHQLRVELRLADLGDVDVRGDAHQVGHFLAQLLDVLAALADHHARAGGVDGDARGLGRALDQDLADPGGGQLLAQHLADLEVGGEVLGVFLL